MASCSPSQPVALGAERGKIRGAAHGVSISSSCSSILVGYRLVRAAEMVNSSLGAPGWCGLIFQEIKSYGYMLSVKIKHNRRYTPVEWVLYMSGITNSTSSSSLKAVKKIQPNRKLEGF
ncbi:hypothetical protein TRIUR3_23265 [Triticum urartu]|uniref:Uncharacterized protein n=1 Tax=Triticum urartu TaxID=4572 RepID=M7ZUN4_TRIUA|nr:hypothetical protein TRIUR3_23265 [Triticum urartu]